MGMLKVFAGIISLLAIILPSFAVAELWNDRRYICLTSQAAGWKNGSHTDLEITDPHTQYIIEPMVMDAKAAYQAKEGYFGVPISHAVKQVGIDEPIALCVDVIASSLDCFWWYSDVRGDLKNAIVTTTKEFTMHVGREIEDPIFMTRLNAELANSLSDGDNTPLLEVGECNQF